jgi:hypothetical protein
MSFHLDHLDTGGMASPGKSFPKHSQHGAKFSLLSFRMNYRRPQTEGTLQITSLQSDTGTLTACEERDCTSDAIKSFCKMFFSFIFTFPVGRTIAPY